jgi:dihydroorotase
VGLPVAGLLAVGSAAEFTVFDLVDDDLTVMDSLGQTAHLTRVFEPRFAIRGSHVAQAARYKPRQRELAPCCGFDDRNARQD